MIPLKTYFFFISQSSITADHILYNCRSYSLQVYISSIPQHSPTYIHIETAHKTLTFLNIDNFIEPQQNSVFFTLKNSSFLIHYVKFFCFSFPNVYLVKVSLFLPLASPYIVGGVTAPNCDNFLIQIFLKYGSFFYNCIISYP